MREVLLEKLYKGKFLQIALDFINIEDAIRIVNEVKDLNDSIIIEIGTPLLKATGIEGIRKIRQLAKDKIILADTKTADAGDVEVEIAKLGGADIMTVLGIMDNATILSAIKKAKEIGMLVQADLINVTNTYDRALELKNLGIDIIGLHVGLDVQKSRGISITDLKDEIRKVANLGLVISVAGGLNRDRIKELIDLPINIFVVGSAITRSKDAKETTKEIINILKSAK
ncbi:MAG: orotidine 5'-phosphate decarboxylase / HUMPS family protein [Saccharolobus sp.]|jgi:3-hexulose-6-phosphate synthase|uniref:orotidine 5'-phosphate decarboxylase / HUMPS family protein n=1 Tax=Saccharolobus sp. TaxID=2100761 RepID=UPI0028CE09C4|nr:orotidine 5'-phosphate decarboxylase / HUMPS family protein [Saccharolobus sp.]MDT7861446.1 orotidine 5'-phosphate decarboxylase / HUMPS family protein [Saccharolobus sp.]